ncbi:hypothetical protein P9477_23665, partial [Enterobacter mori]|uniref:hypothetical protein n=1 Tax=Enterobacter mori TaxID=539813 RepID=UPI00398AA3FE
YFIFIVQKAGLNLTSQVLRGRPLWKAMAITALLAGCRSKGRQYVVTIFNAKKTRPEGRANG